jgi:hypothetical protein
MLGHSCSAALLRELAEHIPVVRQDVKSGDMIELGAA